MARTSVDEAQQGRTIFAKVSGGCINYKCENQTPKEFETPPEEGAKFFKWAVGENSGEYWRKEFRDITGKITKIFYKTPEDTKFKVTLNVTVQDDQGAMVLQFAYGSSEHDSFVNILENADITQPIKISASPGKNGKGTSIFLSQAGENIKWKYTKKEPGNRPQAKPYTEAGVEKWDYKDIHNFFYQQMLTVLIPKVTADHPYADSSPQESAPDKEQHVQDESEKIPAASAPTPPPVQDASDDLPF